MDLTEIVNNIREAYLYYSIIGASAGLCAFAWYVYKDSKIKEKEYDLRKDSISASH